MRTTRSGSGESKLETAISWVLLIGLAVSMILELAGIVLYARDYGRLTTSRDPAVFIRGHDFFSFIADQFRSHAGSPASVLMIAGIIVLMITPYVRVLLSVFYFAWEKDLKYVLITLFVLAVLTVSLVLH